MNLICPVCLGVYFKPISLPCGHTLCKECLERSLDISTLACPICRLRLSIWKRHLKDTDSCIDAVREHKIEQLFPKYYSARCKGLDATLDESELDVLHSVAESDEIHRSVALPGTIKSEFKACIDRLQLKNQFSTDIQEEASLALARQLSLESSSLNNDSDDENSEPLRQYTNIPYRSLAIKNQSASTNFSPKRLRNHSNVTHSRTLSTYFPSALNSPQFKNCSNSGTSSRILPPPCELAVLQNSKFQNQIDYHLSSSKRITSCIGLRRIEENDQIKSDEAFARSLAHEFEITDKKSSPLRQAKLKPHNLRSRATLRRKSMLKQASR